MKKRFLAFLSDPDRNLDIYDLLTLFGCSLALFVGVLLLFSLNNLINLI